MIIEFSLGNYRSFNETQTLSFRATGLVSEDKTVDSNNIVEVGGQKLLKTIGVYGANASGKSNLVKGLIFLMEMVAYSLQDESFLTAWRRPSLTTTIADYDGYFQIILLLEGKKYRYGFTLAEDRIQSEWLFGPAEKNETWYFKRLDRVITINKESFPEGVGIPYDTKLRQDALFLSFCSSYNGKISGNIRSFLFDHVDFDRDPRNSGAYNNTNELIKSGKKEIVLSWLSEAALFFTDIAIVNELYGQEHTVEHLYNRNPFGLEDAIGKVKLMKNVYGKDGKIIKPIVLDLERHESQGTKKFYALVGPLYELFLNGGLFISDEIDSNFHPALLRKIIGMFNNPTINKANAQLLFTSHDTNLMSPDIMRRDQFYFTEKSATDSTMLYSLADLKGIRNNADFAKQYLAGYYGALPMLGNYLEEQANAD